MLLEPENQVIGSVNEDLAVESMAGDVFQLGNAAYRILRVERGTVRVEDAQGMMPNIPFWLGEAPGRTDELSRSVSRLRAEIAPACRPIPRGKGRPRWLVEEVGIAEPAAEQLVEYLASAHAALGILPTQDTLVFERFFDETGGMQLVIHSPYGSRINRAWGLALRKRILPQVQFRAAGGGDRGQYRAVADHGAQLRPRRGAHYLHSASMRQVLIQALLDAPMFVTRWRWVAGRVAGAAAFPRRQEGAAAARPHGRRRFDCGDFSRPARLRRKPRWRARDPRPSADPPDDSGLPVRCDGHRRAGRKS